MAKIIKTRSNGQERTRLAPKPGLLGDLTFAQLGNRYIRDIASKKAPSTYELEKYMVAKLIRYFGETPAIDVTTAFISQMLDDWDMKAELARRYIIVISNIYKTAQKKWGLPLDNPAWILRKGKK